MVVRAVADGLLSIVLAPACAACREPLDNPSASAVCARCWNGIRPLTPPFCAVCGDPLLTWRGSGRPGERCARCRTARTHITLGRALGHYDGALRAILHALKYDGRTSVADTLSLMMRQQGAAVLAGADVVVPVPLHWRRRWTRGFNQADRLAAGLGVPVRRVLRRARPTRPQSGLPEGERQANVRDAFRVKRGAAIGAACVVVVDDVSTTGATLEACAKALRAAGAKEVRTLTAARVVTQPPDARRR